MRWRVFLMCDFFFFKCGSVTKAWVVSNLKNIVMPGLGETRGQKLNQTFSPMAAEYRFAFYLLNL